MADTELPLISHWLTGKSIFVTGATGFIGKVLVEKLLRSNPKLDKIYMLIREKKGKSPNDRIRQYFESPMFENVKKCHDDVMSKVVVISGDTGLPQLGISPEDRQELVENVAVVFHSAASVRFDHPLKKALFLNTRGTKDCLDLAKQMLNLEVFVHVSTAYTNCEHRYIKEKIYPARADWRKILKVAERMSEHDLEVYCEKILGETPNTYIYTKSLAEYLVYEQRKNFPVVIYRPSVVANAVKEPMPGWIDCINSLSGICCAVCKGVLRVYGGPKGVKIDYVPVDVCVNGMIACAWYRSVYVSSQHIKKPKLVFNCTTETCPSADLADYGLEVMDTKPMADTIWEPTFIHTSNTTQLWILTIFLHVVPGIFFDLLLKFSGRKPVILSTYRVIYITSLRLALFLHTNWTFETKNFDYLKEILQPEDFKDYPIDKIDNLKDIFSKAYDCMRVYIFGEKEEIPQEQFAHRRKIYWVVRIWRVLIVILLLQSLPISLFYTKSLEAISSVKEVIEVGV